MHIYRIKFIALNDSISFEVESENMSFIEEFVSNLFQIFITSNDNGEPILDSLQENKEVITNNIKLFVNKYNKILPEINGVMAFFNKLKIGENFYLFPNIKLEQSDVLKIHDHLESLSNGTDFTELNKQTNELYGDLLNKYKFRVVGDERLSIGEYNRSKRICRFCDNKSEPLTFKSKAHAISEALGNKTVVLHDECDICNNRFSKTIEPDIIEYLSLFRTIFDVKGKGGSKKFYGKNFELINDGQVKINFYSEDDRPKSKEEYKLNLVSNKKIVLQNAYKALTKYFISVIDKSELKSFKNTIRWINGEIEIETLPKIAERINYDFFSKQPRLFYYIRKHDNNNIPFAIGEFHFTNFMIVFIIPGSNQKEKDFYDIDNYNKFWDTFKHYNKTKGWTFKDLSSNEPKEFSINLDFTQRKGSA